MKHLRPAAEGPGLDGILRGACAAVGILLLLVGSVGSIQLFFTAYGFFKKPLEHEELMKGWVQFIGLDDATVEVAGSPLYVGGPIAAVMLFFALYMLIVILGRLLKTGLSLLSWVRECKPSALPASPAAESGEGPLA